MKFTVKLRRDDNFKVKSTSEQIDGKTFDFLEGWVAEDDSIYAGEQVWVPNDPAYPQSGPAWLGEGDLVEAE